MDPKLLRGTIYGVLIGLALWVILLVGVLWLAGDASAAPCEYRSVEHEAQHGGHEADNAWHVTHGDLPTCDSKTSSSDRHDDHREDRDDDKSRFCRQRWFC